MPDWNSATEISDALQNAAAQIQGRLENTLERWDIKLAQLSGDPQRHKWQHFRPLRLRREEDWSDWLAHLLATSKSGQLGFKLFGEIVGSKRQGDFSRPEVEREVVVGKRRADIVLVTGDRVGIHVEVKIWDRQFEKTTETGALVAAAFVPKRVPVTHNVLLVPVGLNQEADCLSVWQEIQLPKQRKAWLDAGLWWDWQLTQDKCVYYANIFYSNNVPLPFDYGSKVEGVLMAKDEGGAYLYRPATRVDTLESDIKELIETRLKQPNRAK